MSLSIRAATVDDCAEIAALIRELASYERLAHEMVATEAQLATTLFGARPHAEVVIGALDGAVAGFALFFHNYSTFLGKPGLYLEDLFVRPAARGRGLGLALMRHLARLAIARDCGRFEWSVLDWNQPALDFYQRLGAVPMQEWTVQRLTGAALQQLAEADA